MKINWVFSFRKFGIMLMVLFALAFVVGLPVLMIAGKNRAENPAQNTVQLFRGTPDQVRSAVEDILENRVSMDDVADDFYMALLNNPDEEKIFLMNAFVEIAKMTNREDYADGEILLHITLLALGPPSDVQIAAKNTMEALQ